MNTAPKTVIRPLDDKDAVSIAENANNIKIWNSMRDYIPYPYSLKDANEFIACAKNKKPVQDFAIIVDGTAAGCIGYIPGPDIERISAEVGFWIGEEYWSKGITTEALTQLISYIFENTGIFRLFAVVFEYNIASMKVLTKAGFRKIAIFSNAAIKNGRIIDLHYFELLKD